MPFLDNRNRDSCLAETADAIAMIESIVNDFPYHDFAIGGDLNTELNGRSPFDPLWKEFTDSHRFAYCSQMFAGPRFTYHHESLGQTKFNDHFIVSESILMDNHKIIEDGHNPSDHLPITMMVCAEIQSSHLPQEKSSNQPKLEWKALNNEQRAFYSD